MVVAIGLDLVSISGFDDQLRDRASRFVEATFTPAEVSYCRAAPSRQPSRHFAVRYAAKEATVKALDAAYASSGRSSDGSFDLRQVEVLRDSSGRPTLKFHARAAQLLAGISIDRALLTLSHDGDVAAAFVVLERI